jgi:hypothetical protein
MSVGPPTSSTRRGVPRWIKLALLGPVGWGLGWGLALAPAWAESLYARGIHPAVVGPIAWLTSFSPWSVGEILLLATIGGAVLLAIRGLRVVLRRSASPSTVLGAGLRRVLAAAGVLYFVFQLTFGLGHARRPFAELAGLDVRPAGASTLRQVCEDLGARAAARRPEEIELRPDFDTAVAAAYVEAAAEHDVLEGPRPSIRRPWISRLLVLSSITGIYSPFTAEPHVAEGLPDSLVPFVAAHEVAHLRGFAREDEANFIAWWVGSASSDPELAYSCELQAFRYAWARLRGIDPLGAEEVWRALDPRVRGDAEAIWRFWQSQPEVAHRTLSAVSSAVNHAYLQSAGHADGVRSYGRMVDLLIAALREDGGPRAGPRGFSRR